MILSTPKQRQLIGFFRKTLKFSEAIYREKLSSYGVTSSKDLTIDEAEKFISALKNEAIARNLYTPKSKQYDNMAARWGFGTPKQLRYLSYLWSKVSNQAAKHDREVALNHFAKKITGCDNIKFLTQKDISKVIKAIEAMEQNQNRSRKYAAN